MSCRGTDLHSANLKLLAFLKMATRVPFLVTSAEDCVVGNAVLGDLTPFSPVLKARFIPSKHKVFLLQVQWVSDDTGGVCSSSYEKLQTHLSCGVHVFAWDLLEDWGGAQHREECSGQHYLVF